jgi:hypothetical protein
MGCLDKGTIIQSQSQSSEMVGLSFRNLQHELFHISITCQPDLVQNAISRVRTFDNRSAFCLTLLPHISTLATLRVDSISHAQHYLSLKYSGEVL